MSFTFLLLQVIASPQTMVGSVSASFGFPGGEPWALVTEVLEEKPDESLPPWVVAGLPLDCAVRSHFIRVQLCATLWIVACPPRLLCPWYFPSKNTGVGCHFLLQSIFPIQGSNMPFLHWQVCSWPVAPPIKHISSSLGLISFRNILFWPK